ncbi:MAG TPA: hypothetical protein ENG61_03615 [Candidatus Korarchaeota archaeon]|nr:hypothetical protein [Candidatus Korarchaeota archaeon]
MKMGEKEKEKSKEETTSKALLKAIASSAATYALLATILERKEIMEILSDESLSMKEKLARIAKEYLPEKHKEDLLELGAAVLTGLIVAGKEKAKQEEKEPKEAVKEIADLIKKLREGEEETKEA